MDQPTSEQLKISELQKKCCYFKYLLAFLVVCLIIMVVMYETKKCKCRKSTFINVSEYGFRYDQFERRFEITSRDRPIAIAALQRVLSDFGKDVSIELLGQIPNAVLIDMLTAQDQGSDFPSLIRNAVDFYIIPSYTPALGAVIRARTRRGGDRGKFVSAADKQLVYNHLVSYFRLIGAGLSTPMTAIADLELIIAFNNRKEPRRM